ncbi:hypothetical protein [Bacillus sp. JJ722]|uniref:hypothetical protein n=1 Tax=Bacillus sp. JJ722 TaxID=3122973 RepID=UPI002FFE118A
MNTIFMKAATSMELQKQKMAQKVMNFLKEEKSARGLLEEGWLMYAAIALGIILLIIAMDFLKNGYSTIGQFFLDGVTGKVTDTPGWGTK